MKRTTHSALAAGGALALLIAASTPLAAQTYTFGSANDGLAGFTQSTVALDGTTSEPLEIWTTAAASVQYRNQGAGTLNSSFLDEIILDRSVGKAYRMEGVVTLTNGYADDNNRVGLYLFGDAAEVPNEDEAGAVGLIFNSDDGTGRATPDSDEPDGISLRIGIDSTDLSGNTLRNQTPTSYAQDLFGTTLTLSVEISFTNDGADDRVDIVGKLTDADGSETITSSISVLAADYTGDYFGFVTRARARNFDENDPGAAGNTAENRALPWVMDYVSFSVTDVSPPGGPELSIATAATPGNYDFSWTSQAGKIYDLVSSLDLTTDPATWAVWDSQADIASGGASTSVTDIPGGGDAQRFFAVVEKDPPPLLDEDFDAAGPALPTGWVAVNATTVWDVGDPSALPQLVDGDGTNCAGTNVVAGDYADEVATVTLTSPAVPIPAGGATLSFRQYIDSDLLNGDVAAVRLLDATDTEIVEGDFPVTGIDGVELGWTNQSFTLPPSAASQSVKVVFELTTAADGNVYNGFYVDDVVINAN